jgi:hypothetical protein
MEVHAHSHTPRKKWTHYFWEFLMLFLAVFCGFLAEYQLEHTIEHQRAKEFADLMYKDLKEDTSLYRTGSEQFLMIEKHQDSLIAELNKGFENVNRYELVKHWINSVWALNFTPNQATYEQMKNSGSLRYIKNIELIKSMQEYYNSMLPAISHYHTIQSEFTENRIVPFMEDHINYQEADFFTSKIYVSDPEFFDWNKRTAIKLYNMMALLKNQNQYINNFYKQAKENATVVMQLLEKEYHLK